MCFSDLSGCSLIGLASSFAIAIGENSSVNEVSTLAAFFSALGDNLAIIATQKAMEDTTNSNTYNLGKNNICNF